MRIKAFLSGRSSPEIVELIRSLRHEANLSPSTTFIGENRTIRVIPVTSQRAEVKMYYGGEILESRMLVIDRQPEIDFNSLMRELRVSAHIFAQTMSKAYQCEIDDGAFSPFEIITMKRYVPHDVDSVTGYLSYKWFER